MIFLDDKADTLPVGLAGTPFEAVYKALRAVASSVWSVNPLDYRAGMAWGWYALQEPSALAGFRDVVTAALISAMAPMVKASQTDDELVEYLRQWREYLPTFPALQSLYFLFGAAADIQPISDPESQSVVHVEDTRLAFYIRITSIDFDRPLTLSEAREIAVRATPLGSRPYPYYAIESESSVPVRAGVAPDAVAVTLVIPDAPAEFPTMSFILVDSTGTIVGGALYDGILSFATTYHTIDDDAEVIFVAVEQRTISFINTEHPEFEVALPATISQNYGSAVTLPSVSGTYEDADYTYTPSAWSIGAFGASITLRNNLLAVLLWDETPIVPVLPTVTAFSYAMGRNSTESVPSLGNTSPLLKWTGSTYAGAVIYNNSITYAARDYADGSSGWSSPVGKFEPTSVEYDGNMCIGAKNVSSTTLNFRSIRLSYCSDPTSTVVAVYDSSNNPFNAFKYTANNTDYYYVLDGIQTDWTDDLSSIGYHFTISYLAVNKSRETVGIGESYSLYNESGVRLEYDSTKTYTSVKYYTSSGDLVGISALGITIGYISGWSYLMLTNNTGAEIKIQRVEYTVS